MFSYNVNFVKLALTDPHLIDLVLKIIKNNLRRNARGKLLKVIPQLASFTS